MADRKNQEYLEVTTRKLSELLWQRWWISTYHTS